MLHLIPTMGGGGAERQVTYLARGLTAHGAEVHVAVRRGGPNMDRLEASGATVHRLPEGANHDPRLLPRLVALIRRVRADVVQTWVTQMDVMGGAAAMLTRTPWVLSERAAEPAYRPTIKNRARRTLGRFASAIVANSPVGLAYWNGVKAPRAVVHNAVDLEEIDRVAPDEQTVPRPTKLILFAGRLEDQKNVGTLVEALRDVVATRDAVALLFGEGSRAPALRAQIAATGLGDRIRLSGFTSSLWSLMKRADAFVFPSLFEGQPNVVIEAAACGCPLVISDIPEHRAFLDRSSALIVPPTDVAALRGAIVSALDDPDAARQRAARAREAVAGWSVEHIAGEYLDLYARVARN